MTLVVGDRVRLKVGYAPLGPNAGATGSVRSAVSRPEMYHGSGSWYTVNWDGGDPGYAREDDLEKVTA